MTETWTVLSLLNWAVPYLEKHGSLSPRLDAELLLSRVLDCSRLNLYLSYDQPLAPAELAAFKELVIKRRAGTPIAYILGEREFWSLSFKVNEAVLIPRPETEHLVEESLTFLKENFAAGCPVLDIGSGCGNIILALAHQLQDQPQYRWLGVELRPPAVSVARENAQALGLRQVRFVVSDLFAAVPQDFCRCGLIVANPPYIEEAELASLSREVQLEPSAALNGGADGLDFYRRITAAAGGYLLPGGGLFFEVGAGQATAVRNLLTANGFALLPSGFDLAGIERVVKGCYPKP